MLSVTRTQELFASLNLSDEEAEHIRDVSSMLAEITYETWNKKRKKVAQAQEQKPNENKTQNIKRTTA